VYLREAELLGQLDELLADRFALERLDAALTELAVHGKDRTSASAAITRARLAECDRQISQYRASLDVDGDPP
jgi:hypothetical protein